MSDAILELGLKGSNLAIRLSEKGDALRQQEFVGDAPLLDRIDPEAEDVEGLGLQLGSLALPGAVRDLFLEFLGEGPLRLGLIVDDRLAHIPWELMRIPEGDIGCLALFPAIQLLRLTSDEDSTPGPPFRRVLIAHADPQSDHYPALANGLKEMDSVYAALRTRECRSLLFDKIEHTTLWSLHRYFSVSRCDVFHFIGHGDLKPSGGVLALEGGRPNQADEIYAEGLAELLLGAGVRVVILSGCRTGGSAQSVANDLCRAGMEAVIAMQSPISDQGAHLFSRALYAGLVEGVPLAQAVSEARAAISGCGLDWRAPVLLAKSLDAGRLVHAPSAQTETQAGVARGNLPAPLTSFIGRARDIERAAQEIKAGRMVTLLGSGGIGKTRLSIETARRVAGEFRHGTWQILLDEIADASRVLEAIGKPFGIVDSAGLSLERRLLDFLREQEMLLVLDNCEHLLEGCREAVNKILRECPGVKVLATSRFVLNAGGECVIRVPSLSHPELAQVEKPRFDCGYARAEYEAIELFCQRGKSADHDFELAEQDLESVCRIAYRLDGIPLAIEIAAARLRSLTPGQIWEMLSKSFDLLNLAQPGVVPRHETVRAAIDWSFQLLSAEDQLAFKRLSIIAGPFDLPTAEALLDCEPLGRISTYEQVSRLVDRSLLVSDDIMGEKRFRMLDMTRDFARRAIEGGEEYSLCQARLLRHFARFASEWISRMQSGDQQLRLQAEMSAIHNSVLSSLEWGIESTECIETAGALVRDLFSYWLFLGDWTRGERLLLRVLDRLPTKVTPLRIQVMTLAGGAAVYSGRTEGLSLIEEAHTLAQSDPSLPIGYVRAWYFSSAYLAGNDELAVRLGEDLHRVAREQSDKRLEGFSRYFLGHMALEKGDLVGARAQYQELLDSKEALGDIRGTAFALCQLAHLNWLEKKGDPAAMFRDGLQRLKECEDFSYMANYATLCSEIFLESQPERAALLQGWSEKVQEGSTQEPDRLLASWISNVVQATQGKMGDSYIRLSEDGRTLSPDAVLNLIVSHGG